MNLLSIGFCLVGNFDTSPPKTEQLIVAGQKMLDLAAEFNMGDPSSWLKYHCEYATYKSCPGKLFPKKEKMIEFLGELKNGFINYTPAFQF